MRFFWIGFLIGWALYTVCSANEAIAFPGRCKTTKASAFCIPITAWYDTCQNLGLRGGMTDWSDDSAGNIRARLRMVGTNITSADNSTFFEESDYDPENPRKEK